MPTHARVVVGALLAGAWLAAAAQGAEPGEGAVSREAPAVIWKGNASGSPVIWADLALASQGQPILCPPVFCDAFTLHVADFADLRVESSSCEDDVTAVEVERPDGSRAYADGLEGSPRTIVDIPHADIGTYVVRTLVNRVPAAGGEYIGHATLATPPPRVLLTAIGKTVATARARSAHRVSFQLSASGPISTVQGTLRRAGAIVGRGRLEALDGMGRLGLNLSRALRPGVYQLTVTADDETGQVVATARLRVARRGARARSASVRATEPPSTTPATLACG